MMGDEEKLLGGLKSQIAKYREMVAVASQQKAVLDTSDMDALLLILDRKRRLLAEVNEIEKEIGGIKARWPEMKAALPPETVKEIETAILETRDVLGELVNLEEQWKAAMEQRKDVTAEELKGISQKRKARNAYGGPPKKPPDTRFYDDKK